MSYFLLILILSNGHTSTGYAYGSRYLCEQASHGRPHICRPIVYASDR